MPQQGQYSLADAKPIGAYSLSDVTDHAPAAPAKTWLQTAEDFLPTVGGTIGAMVGGIPGSALGGAAGEGYKTLAQHLTELPAALRDIASNTAHGYGGATARGFAQGAGQGALQSGEEGAIQGASTLVGNALSKGAAKLAPALMQSALKPGLRSTLAAVKSGETPPVVQTLLKEGVNVTNGGIAKLNAIINASNDEIRGIIDSLPQKAQAISAQDVATRLQPNLARASQQVNPAADVAAVRNAAAEFQAAHGPYMTIPEAQAVKEGTYQSLQSKAYGELQTTGIEAQKALARGLKEEIAGEAQRAGMDISAPNAREGMALQAREAVAQRVAQVANRDPAGLAWLAHNPTTFVLALAQRNPAVKSLIARGLYNSAAATTGVPAEAIRWAVGALAASQDQPQEPQ